MWTPCSACGTHRRPDGPCPHCGQRARAATASAAAIALALLAAGCTTTQPLYGTTVTDLQTYDTAPPEDTSPEDTGTESQ